MAPPFLLADLFRESLVLESWDSDTPELSSNLTVELVRIVKFSNDGRASVREDSIGTGVFWKAEMKWSDLGGDVKIALHMRGLLKNERGKQGGEASWSYGRSLSLSVRLQSTILFALSDEPLPHVQYIIRLTLRPPVRSRHASTAHPLPSFSHDEPIEITTHDWDMDDMEVSYPAIGMIQGLGRQASGRVPTFATPMSLEGDARLMRNDEASTFSWDEARRNWDARAVYDIITGLRQAGIALQLV